MKIVIVVAIACFLGGGVKGLKDEDWCQQSQQDNKGIDLCQYNKFKQHCPVMCAKEEKDDEKELECCKSMAQLCPLDGFKKICPTTCSPRAPKKENKCCSSLKQFCHHDDFKERCFTTCAASAKKSKDSNE